MLNSALMLDGGQRPAGELQLALLRQALGIEDPAPRLEGPAADADPDRTCHDVLLLWLDRRNFESRLPST